jgi:hypothetical protein
VWNETFEFAVQPLLMQGMLLTLTVEDFSVSRKSTAPVHEPVSSLAY